MSYRMPVVSPTCQFANASSPTYEVDSPTSNVSSPTFTCQFANVLKYILKKVWNVFTTYLTFDVNVQIDRCNVTDVRRIVRFGYMRIASFRLDYEYEIEYEYDFSILVFRLHIITTHTNFIPWATLST